MTRSITAVVAEEMTVKDLTDEGAGEGGRAAEDGWLSTMPTQEAGILEPMPGT